jgi:ribonuclease P protein component
MSAMCATQSNFFLRIREPLSLSKARRLLRSADFREVYQTGIRMNSPFFAAFCLHRGGSVGQPSKFGFTVPRALGDAVVRNRIRRRMREAVRLSLAISPNDWAVVFNPRRSVIDAKFEDLCRATANVMVKCSAQS